MAGPPSLTNSSGTLPIKFITLASWWHSRERTPTLPMVRKRPPLGPPKLTIVVSWTLAWLLGCPIAIGTLLCSRKHPLLPTRTRDVAEMRVANPPRILLSRPGASYGPSCKSVR